MSGNGRVYYVVPEIPQPSGGIKVMVRHVELLNEAGVDAAMWTQTPGFSFPWLDESAPMVTGPELEFGPDDLLVLPEAGAVPGWDPAPGVRKVLFNQAHYLTYLHFDVDQAYPGWDPLPHVWVVSQESESVLNRTEPGLPVRRIPNPIDSELFRPAPQRVPSIAWMPRRRREEAGLVERLLRRDPRAQGVEFFVLDGATENEVAQTLGRASVFLSMGMFEGWGMPIAEALSAGCLVAGYTAGGGREMFQAPGTWQVPDSSPVQLADRALELVAGVPDEAAVRAGAREWIRARHDPAVTAKALLDAVHATRELPGRGALVTHPVVQLIAMVESGEGPKLNTPSWSPGL